jgi:hypothetical protein
MDPIKVALLITAITALIAIILWGDNNARNVRVLAIAIVFTLLSWALALVAVVKMYY